MNVEQHVPESALPSALLFARHAAGHTQVQCVSELRALGATISQSTLSQWENGKQQPRRAHLAAIRAYIRKFNRESPLNGSERGDDTGAFTKLVRTYAGEPLLGPRQGALVDASIDRVRTGPPMSEWDWQVLEELCRILGLGR